MGLVESGGARVNIFGLLRVRNEERWIERAIKSLFPMCAGVMVLDDHSTDATVSLASVSGADVIQSSFVGFNEVRDKQFLLDVAITRFHINRDRDWVIWIDGDEVLEHGGQQKLAEILQSQVGPSLSFRFKYLWNDERTVRTDRWYSSFSRPSMFRPRLGHIFSSPYQNGMHCSNVPSGLVCTQTEVSLLHYGYMLPEDRIRKYHYYTNPANTSPAMLSREDGYRHMVIGDLFPAESKFMYAGPLELRPL